LLVLRLAGIRPYRLGLIPNVFFFVDIPRLRQFTQASSSCLHHFPLHALHDTDPGSAKPRGFDDVY